MEGSSCDKIQDMLFDYLDNELSEADRNTVEDHTEKCEKCRKELETRRKLLQLISDSAYYPKSELAAAFSGNQALLKKPKKYNSSRYGTVAAAAVLMATIALSQGFVENFIRSDNAAMESAVMYSGNGSAAQVYDYAAAETYAETTAAAISTTVTMAGAEETVAETSDTEPERKLMFSASPTAKAEEGSGTPTNDAISDQNQSLESPETYSDSSTVLYSAKQDDIALMASPEEIMSAWLNACAPMYAEDTAVLYVLKPGDSIEIDESAALEVMRDEYTVTYVFADEDTWIKEYEKLTGSREYYVYRNKTNKSASYAVVIYDLPLEVSGVN